MEADLVFAKIGCWFKIIGIGSSVDTSDVDLGFSSAVSISVLGDGTGEAVGIEEVALVSFKIGSWSNMI